MLGGPGPWGAGAGRVTAAPCPCPCATELLRTGGERWARTQGVPSNHDESSQGRIQAEAQSPSPAHSSVLSEPQTTDHWLPGESEKCRDLAVETQNQWAARARGVPRAPRVQSQPRQLQGLLTRRGLFEARVVTTSPHTLGAVGPRLPQNLLGSGRDGGGRTSA